MVNVGKREQDRIEHKKRYRANAAYREACKARAREYGQRHAERRKAYMQAYTARKRLDPVWVEAQRARGREKQRKLRVEMTDQEKRDKRATRRDRRFLTAREVVIEAYLRDKVIAAGGMCQKFIDPGRRGAPDRLVILPGHPTHYVELKRPRFGYLEPHQQRYHDDLRRCGQRVWVLATHESVDAFMVEILL